MAYPDKTQGTTSFNAIEFADAVFGTMSGSSVTSPAITGSSISGSTLALPSGMPGVCQILTGTTAAAQAQLVATHGLGAAPAHVSITSMITGSGVMTVAELAGTSITVQSSLGTQAWSAVLWK